MLSVTNIPTPEIDGAWGGRPSDPVTPTWSRRIEQRQCAVARRGRWPSWWNLAGAAPPNAHHSVAGVRRRDSASLLAGLVVLPCHQSCLCSPVVGDSHRSRIRCWRLMEKRDLLAAVTGMELTREREREREREERA